MHDCWFWRNGSGHPHRHSLIEGYEVNLCVVSGKGFDHKRALLEKPLKRQVVKEKITQERMDEIMGKITISDINGCKEADLIVESAIENLQAKEKLLKEIEEIAKPDALIASNTSSLSITEISSELTRPIISVLRGPALAGGWSEVIQA